MCGIAGMISNTSSEPNLSAMLDAMKHRGPDDRGVWVRDGIHFGHNRLAIIDLSPAGHQPMVSASGRYVMVYNGEVYNFQSLRNDLLAEGITFRSHSDSEVILALWELEQEACVSKLRGMFAIAIWDIETQKLTLVRDRLGIKPLYYAETAGGFVFASEIKGMLASGLVKKEVNPNAISHLLNTGYIQQPDTMLTGVYALMPGHILTVQTGTLKDTCYWNIQDHQNDCNSEQEAVERIRALVIDSVKEEMVSDRPIGVFLSGGLDSTLLVGALRAAGHNAVKTFTVGFDSSVEGMNEASDAAEAAAYYETAHTAITASGKDLIEGVEDFIEAIDQPSVDGLNTWLVSKYTAPHVTVALSGLGGDELFSGYGIDRRLLYWNRRYGLPIKLLNESRPLWKRMPAGSLKNRVEDWSEKATLSGAYSQWGRTFTAPQYEALTSGDSERQTAMVHKRFEAFDPGLPYDTLQRISALHLSTFMGSRLLRDSDAVSMAHSMEVRFPVIDHRLVELVFPLPMAWKIKQVKEAAKMKRYESENSYEQSGVKHLLYQAFKADLPEGFGSRPKRGFRLPIQEWLKAGLEDQIKACFFSENTYFRQEALNAVWNDWKAGKTGWGQVWTLFLIESWIKKYLA